MTRIDDEDAIFWDNGADAGKITLSKISWFMPHVIPADKDKMELYDSAWVPQTTSFSWRLSVKSSPEVPRFIIVGFQTDKSGSQEQNPSIFDNVKVSGRLYFRSDGNKMSVVY